MSMFQRTTCLFKKKRKRRGDFLQDTWPGNLVQLHPARHPQTFINFFRSNCQPFHARSYLPWRSGFQRLSLQSSAVNFLKLFTFRIFTGVDRKSSALSCPSCVSCGCFFSTGSNFCVFFLFARWSYHHAWMPAVFPRCFDGIYTSMMKRTRQKLHHRNRVFRVFEQISGGGPWHRWRRTNPLKSHLEERGEIPPMFFFDSFNQLECLLIHNNFNSNLIILTAGPRIHQSSNSWHI